ncbi:MAG: 16S rRNA (cytidine(1402)-2'-O)-methyltransferase [Alphaproteobacteria bacterium]
MATPIGHADDITLRALDTLEAADLIVCEDTRVTGRLLSLFSIACPLQAYHDHNAAKVRPRILEALAGGAVVALVSDAGTPLISDPGYKLVSEAVAAGHAVHPIPGASATLAALSVGGLPTDRFFFAGFLPVKAGARRSTLKDLAAIPSTLVFFETGARLAASLEAMADVLGPRPAAVARELTKTFEDVRRGSLPDLARAVVETPPKGEIVVLVGPPDADTAAGLPDDAALDAALKSALREMPLKGAVAAVTADLGLPRRTVYQRALTLRPGLDKDGDEDGDGDAGEGP